MAPPEPTSVAVPEDLLERIGVLRGRDRRVEELPGGLTNRNYKVTTADGTYVVRVSPEATSELSVDRDHEYRNSLIAARGGVGAPVVDYLPGDRILVIGFIEGETFSDESFAVPGNLARVAESCRLLHSGERFVNDFDMFATQRRYLGTVLSRGYQLPAGYLDHAEHVEAIRAALERRAEPTVPCNNDLLAGNFVDDGSRVHIIDYEYSGNNDACFELGNLWSECHLSLEQLEELVTLYYGRPRPARVARAQLQGLMSRYGWTLWASIQQATSNLDFDFWSWGIEKYEAALAVFRSRSLSTLLDRAAEGPD